MKKKVLFILVDSLMPQLLEHALDKRLVPGFEFLTQHGTYSNDVVTVFPTMTASIDTSMITGVYPHEHGVPGLVWYDSEKKKIINYINGAKCVAKIGIKDCAKNVVFDLNEDHMSKNVETIFEALATEGLSSGSINLVAHRGTSTHQVKLPTLVKSLGCLKGDSTVPGPNIMTLGQLVYPETLQSYVKQSSSASPLQRYGVNDTFATEVCKKLIQEDQLPDFTMLYLPDHDHQVHIKGPQHAEHSLVKVDQYIQQILSAFGSWEKAREQVTFIITSDHGQTFVGKQNVYNIDLDKVLNRLNIPPLGSPVDETHQLVVCNNERMAYLYPLKQDVEQKVIDTLKEESRIDILAWKEKDTVHILQPGSERRLQYKMNGPQTDTYGQKWELKGDLKILDLDVTDDGKINYGDYPDVCSRLYGALFSQDCPLMVVTSRPGYEFKSRYFPTHNGGGSHGSLHLNDSTIPFIVSEKLEKKQLPKRLVEFKSFFLDMLHRKVHHK
ncbi:alkaline phosphatase family protein [Caldalkalibacillus salinus]|uniref:alkaline phosphatase family protein n=1 Tax=Caldalkalibacillus salinus TaxID=2803787 RepID=UPI001F44529B|nr:alkaline phosphatase family protein [Caldalkalibacillus salinus]